MVKSPSIKTYQGQKISIHDLEKKLAKKIDENISEYIFCVAHWFAYTILTANKHILIHDSSSPWVCSGKLVDTGASFQLNQYPLLKDFLKEYNGIIQCSHQDEHEMMHETYEDELSDLTIPWILDQLETVIAELFPFLSEVKIAKIVTEMMDDQFIQIPFFIFSKSLESAVAEMETSFLFEIGEESAQESIHEFELEQSIAQEILKKIKTMYAMTYAEILPDRIEMPLFQKLKPILIQLAKEGTPVEHIQLLADWSNCSHSVAQELETFCICEKCLST
ncbi:hypothetical protein [Thermoflavimicrobium dichotomicum]|uniref:Uncharacterized protein n=1 Tax=Thermoflavimicrobium dichotomicum TaxID=46223 RepID=A0A1I3VET2_9BACL|nr:hypothetical protein [Thermoflavimicrobium dichotomicum]SFJ93650.1 hypothetical protein SAMN05421852_1461 [Thermoflavimicrobium dichotomicum]